MLALNQTQLMTPTGQESCSIRLTNTLRQMSLNLRKNVSSFWKTGLNLNRHQSLEETKKSRKRLRQSCPRESRKEGRLRWSIKRQGKKLLMKIQDGKNTMTIYFPMMKKTNKRNHLKYWSWLTNGKRVQSDLTNCLCN